MTIGAKINAINPKTPLRMSIDGKCPSLTLTTFILIPYRIVAASGNKANLFCSVDTSRCVIKIMTPIKPMTTPRMESLLVGFLNQIIPTTNVKIGVKELITPFILLSIRLAENEYKKAGIVDPIRALKNIQKTIFRSYFRTIDNKNGNRMMLAKNMRPAARSIVSNDLEPILRRINELPQMDPRKKSINQLRKLTFSLFTLG